MERTTPGMTQRAAPVPDTGAMDLLLVEDDSAHAEALRRSLGSAFRLRVAGSLAEFRREVAHRAPDFVLMDINLPDGQAIEALSGPAEGAAFPVMIMTSQGDETTAVAAMKAGAIDFLVKSPEVFAQMPATIERARREWNLLRESRTAREALRERDMMFRLLTENSGEAILLTAPDGPILSANPEACRMFGYSEEKLCSLGRAGVVDVTDPRLAQAIETRKNTGRFRGELTMIRCGGQRFAAEVTSVLFQDSKGEARSSMIVRDLTDQKRAERALRESEGWLQHIVETLPVGAILVQDGRVVMNRAAERITGYSNAEVGTQPRWFELLYGPRADEMRQLYESDRAAGFPEPRVVQLRRKDGALRWVSFAGVASMRGEFRLMHDVTDARHAEEALRESESRFRIVANAAPTMIWMSGPDGRVNFVNQGWLDFTGRSLEDELGEGWESLLHPGDAERVLAAYHKAFADRKAFSLRFRMRNRDGEYRWVEDRGTPRADALGRMAGFIGATMDVTETQNAEQELRIAATAFDAQEGMFVASADGRLLRVNRAFGKMIGIEPSQAAGHGFEVIAADRFDSGFYRALCRAVVESGFWQGEILCRRASDETFPASLTVSAVTAPRGEVTHLVGSLRDVSERRAAEEEIRRLAFYDPLTGLPNRRLLHDRMQHAFAASARSGSHGAVFFIDLDHFKTLNDTRGHTVGDQLLMEISRRLTECVRRTDTVARLGGDEFVVIAEDLGVDRHVASALAEGVATKMLNSLSMPCPLPPGDPHEGSCSIGVTLFRGFEISVDESLRRADAAMYRAKAAGRNGLDFFDPALQVALEQRAALESDLRHAAERSQLRLHFQVQMSANGEAVGAEALVRWEHPTRGLIPPGEFIALAEETGVILSIGDWVLRAACAQLAVWAKDPVLRRLRLAVNVSPRQFRRHEFVEHVQEVLTASGADPAHLKLELTEGTVLDDVDVAITRMKSLRALGIGFSMDDFGTGYSSLAYLKRLPLEQLKIDRSFVRDLRADSDDAMIVQAIIGMARNLRLDVIAEGVEDLRQLEFLRANGCFAFQGYLFSPPVPLAQFEDYVRATAVTPALAE
jgi:diguanylate cyclase (GGDEF)-like protein/PAS domain S-box-containing protein